MRLSPIVARELMTQARRRRSFGKRTVVPIGMLAVLASNFWSWHYVNGGPSTVKQVALFGQLSFGLFTLIQIIVTGLIVPDLASQAIAEEVERRTLPFLLASSLSSTTIILEKLAASLLQYASCLIAGLPVVMLLPCLGGVEPALVLWTYAGIFSTALFLAALSIAVAIAAGRARQAKRDVQIFVAAWTWLPLFAIPALAPLAPRLYSWIRPLNELLLASNPLSVLLSRMGWLPRGTLIDMLSTMFTLQLSAAAALILGAIVALRPASRWHEDGETRLLRRLSQRRRFMRRPACGDDAVLWKEMHMTKVWGIPWLLGMLLALFVFGGIGIGTYYAGRGAMMDVLAHGYAKTANTPARLFFANYLRTVTLLATFVYTLMVTGFAAEAITLEKTQDTWVSLTATPLTGREILHAKMFGAFWRLRVVVLPLVALWVMGMLAGSVHPLGFALSLVGLAVMTWFLSIFGAYGALKAPTFSGGANVALLPVLLLDFSGFLPKMVPQGLSSVFLGVGSFPLMQCLALLSIDDLSRGVWRRSSAFPLAAGIGNGEGTLAMLLAVALSILLTALAAAILERLASRQFDRLIGRPFRIETLAPVTTPPFIRQEYAEAAT